MRRLSLLLFTGVLLVAAARAAAAEQAAVVLDRGAAAGEQEGLAQSAVKLVAALRERGLTVRFYVYGARPDGRIRAAELRGDPAEALQTAAEREGWGFEGPTDPRHGLHTVVRRVKGTEALLVLLVGPFAGEGGDEGAAAEALATWNVRAPVGSRVFAIGLETGREALVAEAAGWVGDGAVVFGAEAPAVEAAPFSPLASTSLSASIRVPLDALVVGGGASSPLLLATSAAPGDQIEPLASEGETTAGFRLRREGTDARVATLSFAAPDVPSVLWLGPVPEPRTFRWDAVERDAILLTPGTPDIAPFIVAKGEVGRTYETRYRLVRTTVGAAPLWTARGDGEGLPEGLEVGFGPESALNDDVVFRDVTFRFQPASGRPLRQEGQVRIAAEGHDRSFRVPFRIDVPAGRVHVVLEAPDEPAPLPPADEAPPWTIRIDAKNANVPARVRLAAHVEPAQAASELVARLATAGGVEVGWDLQTPIDLRPGLTHDLRIGLAPGVRGVDATIEFALAEDPAVQGDSSGRGRVCRRAPKLRVEGPTFAYRVEDGRVVGAPPLVLAVDDDGGTGSWRLALLETTPTLARTAGPDPGFAVRPIEPGRWVVEATESWPGARGGAFAGRRETASLHIEWSAGEAPGAVDVPILVPPRWGKAGWILVGLAVLALGVAAFAIAQLRPPPLGGTLLYTVAGRERAVGRLDLAPAGRRPGAVRAVAGGRLELGGGGEAVAWVRPTRVGGILVLPGADGPEEHLLVDGLTVDAGTNRLRYVSEDPGDAQVPLVDVETEDLLGPEFELESGRIDAAGRPPGPGRADSEEA